VASPWTRTAAVAVFKQVPHSFPVEGGIGHRTAYKTLALEHTLVATCKQLSGVWCWKVLVGNNFLASNQSKSEHSARAAAMKVVRAKMAEFEKMYFPEAKPSALATEHSAFATERSALAAEHMQRVHGDGSECLDGCDAGVLR
jgi:hypothetical protein